jgi:hypothetical protein
LVCDTRPMLEANGASWGNVPAWVGSVLSGISVLLLIFVILRGRRGNERMQANSLVCAISTQACSESEHCRGHWVTETTLRNLSDMPFTAISLIMTPRFAGDQVNPYVFSNASVLIAERHIALQRDEAQASGSDVLGAVKPVRADLDTQILLENMADLTGPQRPLWLAPRETRTIRVTTGLKPDFYVPYLYFTDGQNRRWKRNLLTWRLSKNRRKSPPMGTVGCQ